MVCARWETGCCHEHSSRCFRSDVCPRHPMVCKAGRVYLVSVSMSLSGYMLHMIVTELTCDLIVRELVVLTYALQPPQS